MLVRFVALFVILGFQIQDDIAAPPFSHEFSPGLGLYNGDALRSTELGAFAYNYHWTSTFWIGAEFQGGRFQIDEPNGLGLRTDQKYILVDGTLSWNIPSLLGATLSDAKHGFESDLYTSFGAGKLWLGNRSTPVGIVGGGLLLHFPIEYLALRFDLKGVMYSLSNSQGSDFNIDSLLSLGPTLLF